MQLDHWEVPAHYLAEELPAEDLAAGPAAAQTVCNRVLLIESGEHTGSEWWCQQSNASPSDCFNQGRACFLDLCGRPCCWVS